MDSKRVKDVVLIFSLALLVRIVYILFFVEPEYLLTEDQSLYIQLAQQFIDGGFLGVSPDRLPGYPLFIASVYSMFGEGLWGVVLIQVLLDSISCVVIALMAHLIFGKGFLVAGILSAFNLNMVILSATLLTDTLFLFLFILFLFSLLQYFQNKQFKWLALLVLFISMATLVRPSTSYLLPILLIFLVSWRLWCRDNILKIGTLTVLYLVIVVGLLHSIYQRNYYQYEVAALTSQTGTHLLGWVVPATYQYSGQGSYQDGQQLVRLKLTLALQRDQLEALPQNPFESSLYQTNIAKDILFELGFLNILKAWAVGSVVNLLAPSVSYAPALRAIEHPSFYETKGDGVVEKLFFYIKNSSETFYLLILAVGTIMSVIFTVLVFLGAFKMILVFSPVIITTLLFLVIYFLTITGPVIGVKYRLPMEPILTLFTTYFLNEYFINRVKFREYFNSIQRK
jgi:4-amino-4-deoxy-L-arabinose transferase-like glycosyltransferase